MTSGRLPDLEWLRHQGVFTALDVHFARAVARMAGTDDPRVLLGAAVASRAPRHGHVCAELSRLAHTVRLEPREDQDPLPFPWPAAPQWCAALGASPLVGDGEGAPTPLVLAGDRLYLERYWRYQQQLIGHIEQRCQELVTVEEEPLRAGLARLFPPTGEEPDLQRLATLMAVLRRFCVISGGPGTGKTHTLVRILALLVVLAAAIGAKPPRVAMMAPTGKAAARMKEAVRQAKGDRQRFPVQDAVLEQIPEEASTIHRGLGWQPRTPHRFRHHGENLLPADVVVVDEASMVPVTLMARLVDVVPPAGRLILLGDRDQLASVEAGAVLGDICGAGAIQTQFSAKFARQVETLFGPLPTEMIAVEAVPPIRDCTIHLSRSHRFGKDSGIRAAAGAVIAGDRERTLALLRGEAGPRPDGAPYPDLELVEVEDVKEFNAALRHRLVEAFEPLVTRRDASEALETMRSFRVLCAHRRGLLGATSLNLRIRRWLAEKKLVPGEAEWYPGRPVLITENDYQLNLFNGDDGVVLPSASDGGDLRVFFHGPGGEGLRILHPARLPAHETVFAMTIH